MYKIYNQDGIIVAVSKNDIDYTVQQLLEGHGYKIVESPILERENT
jgi:ATP phosphoribosyltransferase regulatory subunit HisZ|tara:strand:+ start:563 stop:700 length:138 start_codon:yes stop_codon:yes gene_type:complete